MSFKLLYILKLTCGQFWLIFDIIQLSTLVIFNWVYYGSGSKFPFIATAVNISKTKILLFWKDIKVQFICHVQTKITYIPIIICVKSYSPSHA